MDNISINLTLSKIKTTKSDVKILGLKLDIKKLDHELSKHKEDVSTKHIQDKLKNLQKRLKKEKISQKLPKRNIFDNGIYSFTPYKSKTHPLIKNTRSSPTTILNKTF